MGQGEIRIEHDCLLEQTDAAFEIGARHAKTHLPAAKVELVSLHTRRRPGLTVRLLGRCRRHVQFLDDVGRDVVLQGENTAYRPIVAAGPDLAPAQRVEQSGGDANRISGFLQASFEDVLNSKLLGDLLHDVGLALVGEGRVAGDDEELIGARKIGDDGVGNALGEIVLVRIAAQILERYDGDRRLVGQRIGHIGLDRRLDARHPGLQRKQHAEQRADDNDRGGGGGRKHAPRDGRKREQTSSIGVGGLPGPGIRSL